MRRNDTAGTKDRLHDKGGNGAGALKRNFISQHGGARLCQCSGVCFVEWVAIGIGRRNVKTASEKRFILRPEIGIPVNAGTTKMRAMIPLLQADEFGARWFTIHFVILPGQS